MGNIKYVKYKGTKSKVLETGKLYTYKEIAAAANVSYRCMTSRIAAKDFFTDKELAPLCDKKIPKRWRNAADYTHSRFDNPVEALSDKYLRLKL